MCDPRAYAVGSQTAAAGLHEAQAYDHGQSIRVESGRRRKGQCLTNPPLNKQVNTAVVNADGVANDVGVLLLRQSAGECLCVCQPQLSGSTRPAAPGCTQAGYRLRRACSEH